METSNDKPHVTATKLNPIQRAKTKPKSKSLAIKAKCYECMGGPTPDRGWRDLITNCTACECPLYDHRPYQKRTGENNHG